MTARTTKPTPIAWEATPAIEEAWRVEVAERLRQVRAGEAKTLPLADVIARLKKPR